MTENYTIAEHYELPSKGLIYPHQFDPTVKLRSMTTQDEMKRLTNSDLQYKIMSEIIDDCIVDEKLPISSYDMCLGDYQYLLHRLRVVTYGPEYKMSVKCPVCGGVSDVVCDLDSLEKIEFEMEDIDKLKEVQLPTSNKTVILKFQTPRILDNIAKRKKDLLKKNPESLVDPSFLLTLMSVIDTVDDKKLNEVQLEKFVRNLPMRDANILLQKAIKLNESVGLKTDFECKCKHCGFEMTSSFRITPEFYGPTID